MRSRARLLVCEFVLNTKLFFHDVLFMYSLNTTFVCPDFTTSYRNAENKLIFMNLSTIDNDQSECKPIEWFKGSK